MARAGDPASVCKAIEDFGEEVLPLSESWLKMAGGSKSEVLSAAMCRAPSRGSILEIGTYCGYSAIQMSMVCPDVCIITLEADPAHMVIARNVLAFTGLANLVYVWTGHSKDLLHQLHLRYKCKDNLQFRAVFMD